VILIFKQWEDRGAYKQTLLKLAGLFKKNFEVFAGYIIGEDGCLTVTEQVLAAGPTF
jgi:phosphoenolpyruvate carboxykinase (ATP)